MPTIVTSVPRGGFADVTAKFYGEVDIPVCTTNRINTPELADQLLAVARELHQDGSPHEALLQSSSLGTALSGV